MGEYGDLMGTLQQISALVVGEMWGLRFCSTEGRLGTINCSLDEIGKMAEEKKKVCFRSWSIGINCFRLVGLVELFRVLVAKNRFRLVWLLNFFNLHQTGLKQLKKHW